MSIEIESSLGNMARLVIYEELSNARYDGNRSRARSPLDDVSGVRSPATHSNNDNNNNR